MIGTARAPSLPRARSLQSAHTPAHNEKQLLSPDDDNTYKTDTTPTRNTSLTAASAQTNPAKP